MVDCMECTNFIKCHYSGQLTGRLTSCPDFKQKPKTNADRIRAMSDEELAHFLADKYVMESCYRLNDKGYAPTAIQIEEIKHTLYCTWMQWLKQPAED